MTSRVLLMLTIFVSQISNAKVVNFYEFDLSVKNIDGSVQKNSFTSGSQNKLPITDNSWSCSVLSQYNAEVNCDKEIVVICKKSNSKEGFSTTTTCNASEVSKSTLYLPNGDKGTSISVECSTIRLKKETFNCGK